MQSSSVALWLFDETPYRNQVAIDASPNHYDLRYDTGARSRPGVYGNAVGFDAAKSEPITMMIDDYANAVAMVPEPHAIDPRQRRRTIPTRLIAALGGPDWTWEFRFILDKLQGGVNTLVDVRSPTQDVFSVEIDGDRFKLHSDIAHSDIAFKLALLKTGVWHHAAFVQAHDGPIRCFLDGDEQIATGKIAADPSPAKFFEFEIGRRFDGTQRSTGALDEMRVSDHAIYTDHFAVPGSFSKNYEKDAQPAAKPNGPTLLFRGNIAADVTNLGDRKHVFIDDVLVEKISNISFAIHPPQRAVLNTLVPQDNSLEGPGGIASGYGTAIEGPDGKIHLLVENHAMWVKGKQPAQIHITTTDNQTFKREPFFMVGYGAQGSAFRDDNPDTPDDERFKMLTFDVHRGVNLWMSGDLFNWRRNETNALPFDTGGGSHAIWDDQQGLYLGYFRHEGGWRGHLAYENEGVNVSQPDDTTLRADAFSATNDVHKPWPFTPTKASPWVRQDMFTLPTITFELPRVSVRNDNGEPYRMYATKYQFAPDTYIAMIPRLDITKDTRFTELAVSRDGYNWRSYGPAVSTGAQPEYFAKDTWSVNGKPVREALVLAGLIRQGDELWQYGAAKTVKHVDFSADDRLVLLKSRLDGFTSFDAGNTTGTLTTKRLTFKGKQLDLNIDAHGGSVRIALLDSDGNEVKGFGLDDCDPITDDAINRVATWRGKKDVGLQAGKIVQVRFEMRNAKLYAMRFFDPDRVSTPTTVKPQSTSVPVNRSGN